MSFSEMIQSLDKYLAFEIFKINDTSVTVYSLMTFLILVVVFSFLSKFISKVLIGRPLNKFQVDQGVHYVIVRVSHYIMLMIGALIAFQFIGIDLSGLTVIFGFLSVGIGFGLQGITANIFAGLVLLFGRPIKVGDRITVANELGDVTEINMRATTIKTPDNISIIVPNEQFVSGTVINWSHGQRKVRTEVKVGVSYSSDLELVKSTMKKVAEDNNEVLKSPEPEVLLTNFGDSSWDMKLLAWINDPTRIYNVQSELNCAIVHAFRENNIEIPFPQRDLHVRSPLPVPIAGKPE